MVNRLWNISDHGIKGLSMSDGTNSSVKPAATMSSLLASTWSCKFRSKSCTRTLVIFATNSSHGTLQCNPPSTQHCLGLLGSTWAISPRDAGFRDFELTSGGTVPPQLLPVRRWRSQSFLERFPIRDRKRSPLNCNSATTAVMARTGDPISFARITMVAAVVG